MTHPTPMAANAATIPPRMQGIALQPAAAIQTTIQTSDVTPYKLAYRDADHARNGIRIEVAPADDDVETVRQNVGHWVVEVRAACLSKKKGLQTPRHMNREQFEEWLAEQEAKISEKNEVDANLIERHSWDLVDQVCIVHEQGLTIESRALEHKDHKLSAQEKTKIASSTNMMCSERILLILEILSEYAIVAMDIVKNERIDKIVEDPLGCLKVKLATQGSNQRKLIVTLADEVQKTTAEWWEGEETARKIQDKALKQQADTDLAAICNPSFTRFSAAPAAGAPLGFFAAQAGALKRINVKDTRYMAREEKGTIKGTDTRKRRNASAAALADAAGPENSDPPSSVSTHDRSLRLDGRGASIGHDAPAVSRSRAPPMESNVVVTSMPSAEKLRDAWREKQTGQTQSQTLRKSLYYDTDDEERAMEERTEEEGGDLDSEDDMESDLDEVAALAAKPLFRTILPRAGVTLAAALHGTTTPPHSTLLPPTRFTFLSADITTLGSASGQKFDPDVAAGDQNTSPAVVQGRTDATGADDRSLDAPGTQGSSSHKHGGQKL